MKKRLYQIHRSIAKWLALPVILWALSGLLHPMMANWFRPEIANHFLPPTPIANGSELATPAKVFSDTDALTQLKLIKIRESPVYLGITPDQNWLFRDARSGLPIPDAVETYAEQLARSYTGDQSSTLLKITRLTDFTATYGTINRFLPVYRVKLDRPDGLEVVVDPRTGRLASFDTPSKRLFSTLFAWFHRWSFLGKPESPLRITVVLIITALSLLVTVSGLVSLFFIKQRKNTGKRRTLHRMMGGVSALFFVLFSLSGLAHVAAKYNYDDTTQWKSQQNIPVSQLGPLPPENHIQKLSLAKIFGKSYYRTSSKNTLNYHSTESSKHLGNGETLFAQALAAEFSGYPAESMERVEPINNFRKDYGFIFRRLPVQRVHYSDQDIWHDTVDTEDASMAMRTTPTRMAEALSFTYLHKFHFMDFAGRDVRDASSAIAISLICLTAFSGLLIARKRTRQSRREP